MKTAPILCLLITTAPALRAQTVFDWNGGTGNWTTGANWNPATVPNSPAADVLIDNGDAAVSAVTLLNAGITLGRLTIDAGSSLTLTNTSEPAQTFVLSLFPAAFPGAGTILNNGTINISASTGHPLNLRVGDANVAQTTTLNGTGSLNLGDSTVNQILGIAVTQTFVNNSTITGAGTVGGTMRGVVNTGTITATGVINELILAAGNTITNTGTLRAVAGAKLRIQGTAGNADEGMMNEGGLIEADGAGAVVRMTVNRIQGGVLQTRNGGLIQWLNNNMNLDGSVYPITISVGSDVRIPDNSNPDTKGTLIVDGTLTLDSTGVVARLQVTDLFTAGPQSLTLSGSGSMIMTNQSVNEINGTSGSALVTNIPITGGGKIGGNSLNVTNNSIITANGSAGLTLDPVVTFTNHSLAHAVSGSTLILTTGAFANVDGVFRAEGAGSLLSLVANAEIQGGLLEATDGGEIRFSSSGVLVNGESDPVMIRGPGRIPNSLIPLFKGRVVIGGNLSVESTGGRTGIAVPANSSLSLEGGGVVTLTGNASSEISGQANSSMTNHMLIQGMGKVGLNLLDITNGGFIHANQTVGMIIDPRTTFVNAAGGVVRSSAGGGLTFNNGTYTNNGLIEADGGNISSATTGVTFTNYNATTDTLTGGTYRVNGPHNMVLGGVSPVVVNAADVELSGTGSTFTAINFLANNQGTFTLRHGRNFTSAGALLNSGTVHVDGTAVLTTTGNFTLTGDAAALEFEMDVLPPGTGYDAIDVNGSATLDGKLRPIVSHSLAATLTGTETFTVLTANAPVTGAFDNVASGARVADLYGEGSFIVHYGAGSPFGPENLVLSNFSPPPVIVRFSVTPGTNEHAGNQEIVVEIKGAPGLTYDLEGSRNLQEWTVIQSGTAAPLTGKLTFDAFEPDTLPHYFFRARPR